MLSDYSFGSSLIAYAENQYGLFSDANEKMGEYVNKASYITLEFMAFIAFLVRGNFSIMFCCYIFQFLGNTFGCFYLAVLERKILVLWGIREAFLMW